MGPLKHSLGIRWGYLWSHGGSSLFEVQANLFSAFISFSYAPKEKIKGVILTVFEGGNKGTYSRQTPRFNLILSVYLTFRKEPLDKKWTVGWYRSSTASITKGTLENCWDALWLHFWSAKQYRLPKIMAAKYMLAAWMLEKHLIRSGTMSCFTIPYVSGINYCILIWKAVLRVSQRNPSGFQFR